MSEKNLNQVWQWSARQRKSDQWMNKAYINACGRLVGYARKAKASLGPILDVGSGSGLVLRHLVQSGVTFDSYLGIDLSQDGLNLLGERAKAMNVEKKVVTQAFDVSARNPFWENGFSTIFSNFCLYTIADKSKRIEALKNIRAYLKLGGSFHIALPSETYSAEGIALQCFRDEYADPKLSLPEKALRFGLLVPYQWGFVLTPIANKVKDGTFLRFTEAEIRDEFSTAGLEISEIRRDYGGCGYHIHGVKN